MPRAVETLPEGYKEYYSVDLQKNKKTAVFVNVLSLVIAVLLIVPMNFAVPIRSVFSSDKGMIIRFIALILLIVIYMVTHELVHGIAMKSCGTKKVKYGFTGLYAYAGSNDYYDKKSYIYIALAPIVLLGIIIAIVNFVVPVQWFWIVYFIQVTNLSGAAGDLYVSVKFFRFPKDILVKDYGVGMTVFSKE